MSTAHSARGPRVIWFDKPPFYQRAWTYIWLFTLLGITFLIVFQAWHGYHFPCSDGDGGVYNCDADSATRWTAAVREGLGGILCGGICPSIVLLGIHFWWANWPRPSALRRKYASRGIPEDKYLRYAKPVIDDM